MEQDSNLATQFVEKFDIIPNYSKSMRMITQVDPLRKSLLEKVYNSCYGHGDVLTGTQGSETLDHWLDNIPSPNFTKGKYLSLNATHFSNKGIFGVTT